MKTLYLVRHAKSSWDHPDLEDFDRPLSHRGKRDAVSMGKYLFRKSVMPDVVVTSPASRAGLTALLLVSEAQNASLRRIEEGRIYAANLSTLVDLIRSWDHGWQRVMLVGHNPSVSDLATWLTNREVGYVPTCTVMGVSLRVPDWPAIASGCGNLVFKWTPKGVLNIR
jgi:phosphohistidine phosphatase